MFYAANTIFIYKSDKPIQFNAPEKIRTSSNLKWSEFMFFIQLWHLSDIFNRAFLDKSVPKATTINLLRRACNRHQDAYRDAMSGQGIDRHLFALYVISKGMGYVRICIWCFSIIWFC